MDFGVHLVSFRTTPRKGPVGFLSIQNRRWCKIGVDRARAEVAVGQNRWYHFGVGEFTTHFSLF